MMNPKVQLHFLASQFKDSEPVSLIRVKIRQTAPHLAFAERELGLAFLKAKKRMQFHILVPESELTEQMRFDFSSGLLVLKSLEDVNKFLQDPAGSETTIYSPKVNSLNPW